MYAELKVYLSETYGEQLAKCAACHELVGRGESCSTPGCGARLHDSCAASVMGESARPKCLQCRADWKPAPRGNGHTRRSTAASSSSSSAAGGEDEEDETGEDR